MPTGDRRTDVGRFNPDTLLNVCSVGIIRDLVGKNFGLAKGVYKSCTTGSRGTWKSSEGNGERQEENGRTDDHEGELDALLDLVSSASASERHFGGEEASKDEGKLVQPVFKAPTVLRHRRAYKHHVDPSRPPRPPVSFVPPPLRHHKEALLRAPKATDSSTCTP